MAENLKEDSDEDDENEDGDDDGSTSEDSGFQISKQKKKGKKEQSKKTQLKRHRAKAPAPPQAELVGLGAETAESTTPGMETPASQASVSVKSKGGSKNPDKVMAQAASLKLALEVACPLAMWQHPQKIKDVDNKIRKAYEKVEQLKKLTDAEGSDKLGDDLSKLASDLGKWAELVGQLKGAMDPKEPTSIEAHLCTHAKVMATIFPTLGKETSKAVLTDIGKILLEACL